MLIAGCCCNRPSKSLVVGTPFSVVQNRVPNAGVSREEAPSMRCAQLYS